MRVVLAGLTTELVLEDAAAARDAGALLAPYAGEPGGTPELRVRVRSAPADAIGATGGADGDGDGDRDRDRDGGTELPLGSRELVVREAGDGRFHIARADYEGVLARAAGHAEVVYAAGQVHSLSSFLRVVSSLALAPRGGLLAHASSVVRDGRAYLFVGRSGAGKTTICRLRGDGRVLSDEISAVRRSGDGFCCWPTPFWGELEATGEPAESAPLARVLFPEHAPSTRAISLTAARAAHRLLDSVVHFTRDPADVGALLESATAIASACRPAVLAFRPDRSLWDAVER
jgi:hypothetical protein